MLLAHLYYNYRAIFNSTHQQRVGDSWKCFCMNKTIFIFRRKLLKKLLFCTSFLRPLLNKHFLVRQMVATQKFFCQSESSAISPQNPHKILWRIAFHPCYRPNEVPPAGVSPLKTRRKVYWATVGNRRPNVVSLVIDNNSSFLARPRPLIFRTYSAQNWSTSSVDF